MLKNKKGLTLIEIMLVLVLLGVVFSMIGGRLMGALFGGQYKAVKIQIKQIEGYLDQYKLDCGSYPTTDQGGLKALVEKPTVPGPNGKECRDYNPLGYVPGKVRKTPRDPWGNEFVYTSENGVDYVLKSLGQDGVEGGEGEKADISADEE